MCKYKQAKPSTCADSDLLKVNYCTAKEKQRAAVWMNQLSFIYTSLTHNWSGAIYSSESKTAAQERRKSDKSLKLNTEITY